MQFDDYVAARGQALLRLAFVLARDEHLAEDLVQTALTDAFRHWRKVSKADHPDAYVRRILVNAHLAWLRRRSSGERATGETPVEAPSADHADGIVDRDESRRLLDALAPRARTVLVLRYYADLDDAAIAELLDVSTSTVRATASRALATLRERGVPSSAGMSTASAARGATASTTAPTTASTMEGSR
jgi:RNA polymerase sigma-70 factor (sigma-E family)